MSRLVGSIVLGTLSLATLVFATQSPVGKFATPAASTPEPGGPVPQFTRRELPPPRIERPSYWRPDNIPPKWGTGPLLLAIYAPKSNYRQLEPIYIDYQLAIKRGAATIAPDFSEASPLSPNFKLKVMKDGVSVPQTAFATSRTRAVLNGSGRSHSVGFDDDSIPLRGGICVNELCDMTTPGRYTIELDGVVSREMVLRSPKIRGTSNTLEVEVQGSPSMH